MGNQIPESKLTIDGVVQSGNPADRGGAQICENFRVMPGSWLRLRSGRKARYYVGNGQVRQLHAFRQIDLPGSDTNVAQIHYDDGSVKWHWFSSSDFGIDPFGILSIDTANDGAYARENPAAVANIQDRPVFYNGLGLRGSNSKPALCTYLNGIIRYFGLDAYAPSGRPTASFASGSGNNAVLTDAIRIYVGLYHTSTNHYSNVVSAGQIAVQTATGTITVSNLNRLTMAYNNGTEQGELKYCFYATIEGGQVPYLILNSSLNGPFTVAAGASSANLSIASGTDNGWVLDLAHEAPTENYPPRRMKRISYVNGRLYGSLMSVTGTGFQNTGETWERPFDYSASMRDQAAIVWSKASGDDQNLDVLGDPLQCWPLRNISPTPSGEAPIFHGPSPDEKSLLVITSRGTYLLTEALDGLHEWFTVSTISGIVNPSTVRMTQRGVCWVDQFGQIVLLPIGGRSLQILSVDFQELMSGTPRCANYILDPLNLIDRYQVWFADGKSVIWDFLLGVAYSETHADSYTACGTLTDYLNRRHYCVANRGFYTIEAQAEDGLIPTDEEVFTGVSQSKSTGVTFVGRYRYNWNVFGSITTRKNLPYLDILADSSQSAGLQCWAWKDFVQPTYARKDSTEIVKADQSTSDSALRVKFGEHHWIAIKIEFRLSSHPEARSTYASVGSEGDLPANFYGSIMLLNPTIGPLVNRR